MSIQVTCTCGMTLKVRDELAGKRVKCPKCEAVVQVAKSDSIRVTCSCGQLLNAKRSLAGKQVICPACRQPMTIPDAAKEQSSPAATGLDSALTDAFASLPPTSMPSPGGQDYWSKAAEAPKSDRPKKQNKKKKRNDGGAQDPLVIVTAILCILFGLWHVDILLGTFLRVGVAHLASLQGAFSLVQPTFSFGMLAVGIGLLTKQDWAMEMGPLFAYGYLGLLAISAIRMVFSLALFGVGGLLVIAFAIPILGIHAIVPGLLLHVCQRE